MNPRAALPFFAVVIGLFLAAAPLAAAPPAAPADVIGADDLLDIGVADLESPGVETVKTVRVDAMGAVNLFVVGQIRLAGLSFTDAEKLVAQKYRDAGLLANPLVSLNRLEAGSAATVHSGPLAPGDVLRLQILDPAGRTSAATRFVRVSDGGAVGVPFLGQITVAGLTEIQAEEAILKAYHASDVASHRLVSVLRMRGPATRP